MRLEIVLALAAAEIALRYVVNGDDLAGFDNRHYQLPFRIRRMTELILVVSNLVLPTWTVHVRRGWG